MTPRSRSREPAPGPERSWVRIAADRCTGCLDCLPVCRPAALRPLPGLGIVGADSARCTGCRDCVEVCPVRAISVGVQARPDAPELGRRGLLTGAGLLGAGLVAGTGLGVARTRAMDAAARDGFQAAAGSRLPAVPFHGPHQAGIVTQPPPAALFAAFDAVAGCSREDLGVVLPALTAVARQLTAGGTPTDPNAPPDNDLAGVAPAADGLTVTVGVGESLFDKRFGLAGRKPRRLARMPSFPNDRLDPAQSHGDVLIQLRAGHPDTVLRAFRMIVLVLYGFLQPRWRIQGFIPPATPSGASRNLQGFKFGIANPDVGRPAIADRLLWGAADEPRWAAGGSYQVVRIIRMLVEDWDQLEVSDQQAAVGRFRDSGAPLDGRAEADTPQYGKDPDGAVIPLDAHIRLANPRTRGSADSQLLRAGYSYDRGLDAGGKLDMGLIFSAYQQDIRRQFAAVQARIDQGPLAAFLRPVGGGYFFVLPGLRDPADHYGRALLG